MLNFNKGVQRPFFSNEHAAVDVCKGFSRQRKRKASYLLGKHMNYLNMQQRNIMDCFFKTMLLKEIFNGRDYHAF
jgi:hypothetical protein